MSEEEENNLQRDQEHEEQESTTAESKENTELEQLKQSVQELKRENEKLKKAHYSKEAEKIKSLDVKEHLKKKMNLTDEDLEEYQSVVKELQQSVDYGVNAQKELVTLKSTPAFEQIEMQNEFQENNEEWLDDFKFTNPEAWEKYENLSEEKKKDAGQEITNLAFKIFSDAKKSNRKISNPYNSSKVLQIINNKNKGPKSKDEEEKDELTKKKERASLSGTKSAGQSASPGKSKELINGMNTEVYQAIFGPLERSGRKK